MAAGVVFKVLIQSKTRSTDRYRMTTVLNESWTVDCTLDNYGAHLEPTLLAIKSYCQRERNKGLTEITCHYSVTLDNITAAAPPKGAWVQAKSHLDGALTDKQLEDIDTLRTTLLNAVSVIKTQAKY